MYSKIDVKDLKELVNLSIIDIRDYDDYQLGHIPNSINIPMDKLLDSSNKYLDISKVYYIYCESGIMSKKACYFLSLDGYKIIEITGGYKAWLSLRKRM